MAAAIDPHAIAHQMKAAQDEVRQIEPFTSRLIGFDVSAAYAVAHLIQRGPLIYCLEQCDQAAPLHRLGLSSTAALTSHFEPDILGGVVVLRGTAAALDDTDWADTLYRPQPPATRPTPITAIPYYAWDNRSSGEMRIWLRAVAVH